MRVDSLPAGNHFVLATDLDGTLIPLAGNAQNRADLEALSREIAARGATLIFVTGRHFESVLDAMDRFGLPQPDWLICDVGTSIFARDDAAGFAPVAAYQEHQAEIVADFPVAQLRERLSTFAGLRLQEPVKQGRFKLSYYTDAAGLDATAAGVQSELEQVAAPYSMIHSIDPFTGDGLLDLLPASVSKAHALQWWVQQSGADGEAIVFAGDSGNDLAVLTAGYRSIVVGNADRSVAQQAFRSHRSAGWRGQLYLAQREATSGVWEGCRWFGLGPPPADPGERLGATVLSSGTTRFQVWAPKRRSVAVEVSTEEGQARHDLARSAGGYFSATVSGVACGDRYEYVLDGEVARPDPASRFQPDGVHGPSQIVDPTVFPWTDQSWRGVPKRDLVIYELHLGAFSSAGTFAGATERIPELVELGVTAVEIMPVAQSPGRWNWGYDGVDLFAVRQTFGDPDDFRAFVDACHAAGLAVLLDVVYNHLGPEGNYLADFGPYFSSKHRTPWGEAFNFDARHSQHVRRMITENAVYWLREYHLDGLRLDAVHFLLDDSQPTILDEICCAVADYGKTVQRTVHLIAESNVYDDDLLRERASRPAYDAIWSDCLMHSIYAQALPELQLSHRRYRETSDLATALKQGFVYVWQPIAGKYARWSATDRKPAPAFAESLVIGLQTHDAVGNHPLGKRIHQLTSKAYQRAAAALTLLYPGIPLVFMGEEYAAESPFAFFADFEDKALRRAVDQGRQREYPQHVWGNVMPPSAEQTFAAANCYGAAGRDVQTLDWYRTLIALRRRGRAAGWLAWDRMTAGHDSEQDLFRLEFAVEGGGCVCVQARLSPAARSNASPARVPIQGTVLHSSEPDLQVEEGHVYLQPCQAVIMTSATESD